jgi:flavin reductase (DIM6/NTAB) family NADH-FMN oxidoreductase RutF
MIGDGDPGKVAGLIDDESDLWTAISRTQMLAISVLEDGDQQLADRFAGLLPAPGGLFRQGDQWVDTEFGPVTGRSWVGCHLDEATPFGWSLLVKATIVKIELGEPAAPLLHHRGFYRPLS